MKTKLLKLLRKRFYWYKEDRDYWYFYDKKFNSVNYAFIIGMKSNDALIFSMLVKLGIEDIFVSLVDRKLRRMREKESLERKLYFSKFFK